MSSIIAVGWSLQQENPVLISYDSDLPIQFSCCLITVSHRSNSRSTKKTVSYLVLAFHSSGSWPVNFVWPSEKLSTLKSIFPSLWSAQFDWFKIFAMWLVWQGWYFTAVWWILCNNKTKPFKLALNSYFPGYIGEILAKASTYFIFIHCRM